MELETFVDRWLANGKRYQIPVSIIIRSIQSSSIRERAIAFSIVVDSETFSFIDGELSFDYVISEYLAHLRSCLDIDDGDEYVCNHYESMQEIRRMWSDSVFISRFSKDQMDKISELTDYAAKKFLGLYSIADEILYLKAQSALKGG